MNKKIVFLNNVLLGFSTGPVNPISTSSTPPDYEEEDSSISSDVSFDIDTPRG